jgi:two-component sensor histidine kinase
LVLTPGVTMILRQLTRAILPATWSNVIVATAGCISVATVARAAINPLLPVGVPYFTYWLAVDAATFIAGWRAGAIAIVLSTLLGWYIWLPPPFSFDLSPQTLAVVVVYLMLATLQMLLAQLMRVALLRLEHAHNERELLVHELAHRLKNQLAIFSSIATSTLRSARDKDDAHTKLQGRLMAFNAALELAVSRDRSTIPLASLVSAVVRPLAPAEDRLLIKGGAFELPAERAQSFALVLHELATNAVKYGAWSGDLGVITVDWLGTPDHLALTWTEKAQQRAGAVDQKGFGSALIERGIEGAKVEHHVSDTARTVRIEAPLAG